MPTDSNLARKLAAQFAEHEASARTSLAPHPLIGKVLIAFSVMELAVLAALLDRLAGAGEGWVTEWRGLYVGGAYTSARGSRALASSRGVRSFETRTVGPWREVEATDA